LTISSYHNALDLRLSLYYVTIMNLQLSLSNEIEVGNFLIKTPSVPRYIDSFQLSV